MKVENYIKLQCEIMKRFNIIEQELCIHISAEDPTFIDKNSPNTATFTLTLKYFK